MDWDIEARNGNEAVPLPVPVAAHPFGGHARFYQAARSLVTPGVTLTENKGQYS